MEQNDPTSAKRASYNEQAARAEELAADQVDERGVSAAGEAMPTAADEVGVGNAEAASDVRTGDQPEAHGPHSARHDDDPLTIRDADEPQTGGSTSGW